MCLIAWRWDPSLPDSLVLISNRDEYFARPAREVSQWERSRIWAGQDIRAGGTWLGVTDSGRLAAVTNHRSMLPHRNLAVSRGSLVSAFLESDLSCEDFVRQHLAGQFEAYNPFNLLMFDGWSLMGFEGRGDSGQPVSLKHGVGGVSNGGFNDSWPKSVWLQNGLAIQLANAAHSHDDLLDLLLNDQVAPIDLLPKTGIPLDKELALSAPFVRMGHYGTRCSTLVRVNQDKILMVERGFAESAIVYQAQHEIPIRSKAGSTHVDQGCPA